MKKQTKRFAPLCVVLGFVSWCCWQSLEEPDVLNVLDSNVTPQSIKRADLEPTVEGYSARDPFAIVEKTTVPDPIEDDPTILTSVSVSPIVDLTDVLSSLKLNATYVRGNRRLALINGQTLEEGESFDSPASLEETATVARVLADAVVLDVQGQQYRLSYGGLALESATSDNGKSVPTNEASFLRSILRLLPMKSLNNSPTK